MEKSKIKNELCEKCGMEKHAYIHKDGRIQLVCKPCKNERARKWRKENPEKAAELSRENAKKDREKNPERYREAGRKWREKHHERHLEQKRQCDKRHRAERNKANVEYRQKNFEKCSAHDKVKYAKKKGKLIQPERCDLCKEKNEKLHAHHEDYSRPLDILWLCCACHKAIHRMDILRREKEQSGDSGELNCESQIKRNG